MPLLVALATVMALATGASPFRVPDDAEIDRKYREATALINQYEGDTSLLRRAGALLNEIEQAKPGHARAHYQAARVTYLLGYIRGDQYDPASLARARALAERAIELDPSLPEAYFVAGKIAFIEKRLDDVRAMVKRIEVIDAGSKYATYLLADLDAAQGHFDAAVKRYQAILARPETERDRLAALNGIAGMTCRIREDDACEAAYRRYIAANPTRAWSRGNFAQILVRRQKYDEAIEMAESALAIMDYGVGRETLADAHFYKGWDLFQRGEIDGARSEFDKALEALPSHTNALYGLGVVHVRLASTAVDPDARAAALGVAERAFRTGLQIDPSHHGHRGGIEVVRKMRAEQ